MNVRRELVFGIGALMALNLLLAFGAIGLFGRMGPVIARILQENVYSIAAAEDVLAIIGRLGGQVPTDAERRLLEAAVQRAERNITDERERPILTAIRADIVSLTARRPDAVEALVTDVMSLIEVNRHAMEAVDRHAQRLGQGGAWAAVFIGALSFALSLVVLARLRKRVLVPLVELYDTLDEAKRGNPFRRCRPCEAPLELERVLALTNGLLDERATARSFELAAPAPAPSSGGA